MRSALALGLALALLEACSRKSEPRRDDLVLRQRITSTAPSTQPVEEVRYLTPTSRITDDAHSRSIVDLATERMTTIDKDRKTYSVTTFQELQRASVVQQRRVEQAPAELKWLLDPPVDVQPTGRRQKIGGFDAREYIFASGEVSGAVWIADDLRAPMAGPAWEKFTTAVGGNQGPAGKLEQALSKLDGLPVRAISTTAFGADKVTITTEVVEVRHEPPPAEILAVPEGFTKIDTPVLSD
jgi:hypothetical protein